MQYEIREVGPGEEQTGVYEPYGVVKEFFHSTDQEVMLAGPYDTGKGLRIVVSVMTPSGPRLVGDLAPGDLVLASDGTPTLVLGVYPQGMKSIYRVTLSDGVSVDVDGAHLWEVGQRKYKRVSSAINSKRPKIRGSGYDDWRVMSTDELRAKRLAWKAGAKKETRRKYFLPSPGAAQFDKRELSIDPYVMGVLISEGSIVSGTVTFHTGDTEVADEVRLRVPDADVPHYGGVSYGIVRASGLHYKDRLCGYGLWGKYSYEKSIPHDYMYSCISDRVDLLRGLMDGDGTIDHRYGSVSYSTTSKQLAEDVRLLVESLGGYVSSIGEKYPTYTHNGEKKVGRLAYNVTLILPPGLDPFGLERKSRLLRTTTAPRRFIDSIEPLGEDETVCIKVAHPSKLFLIDHFIVTHNTYGAMQKLNYLMWTYRNLHVLVVRKTYSSLVSSAIETLYGKVLPVRPDEPGSLVSPYGGGTPKSLTWPTRSVMKFGGLDEPTRILSAEYDFIFVPQAEELDVGDWEQLLGRANGRAGHSPFPQVIGDCNPDVPEHWIMHRPSLKVFHTTHLDNPTIYARDAYGELILDKVGEPMPTPGGELRLKTLRSMTGLRYKRGFLGLWVGAEGAVYEDFDSRLHVVDRFAVPYEWKKYRVIDFGYTHPFVCQWWAMDDEGRLYMYREMYMTKRTVNTHVNGSVAIRGIIYYTGDEKIETTICDHDAEDTATLREFGIKTTNADKRIQVGLEKVQDRMQKDADGKPRIFFMRDTLVEEDPSLKDEFKPLNTVQELPGYVWQNVGNKVESAKDEKPVKKGDHGMDAMRYLVMYFDGKKTGKTKVHRYA